MKMYSVNIIKQENNYLKSRLTQISNTNLISFSRRFR